MQFSFVGAVENKNFFFLVKYFSICRAPDLKQNVVVVEARSVHVFSYPKEVQFIKSYKSVYNPNGVADVSGDGTNESLAYPADKEGAVQVSLNEVVVVLRQEDCKGSGCSNNFANGCAVLLVARRFLRKVQSSCVGYAEFQYKQNSEFASYFSARSLLIFHMEDIATDVAFATTAFFKIVFLSKLSKESSSSPVCVNAHNSSIARLALDNRGKKLATGSKKGTVIRLFEVSTRGLSLLNVFRRGTDPATLLRFSPCSSFLGVYSDKGTVHIFSLMRQENKHVNKKSILRYVGLEEVEWNCAQFSLPDGKVFADLGFHTVSASGSAKGRSSSNQQYITAVCSDGTFHRYLINPDGTCTREGFDQYLDLGDEQHFWSGDF
ncbi:unnamed protein product [Enterobius vermicularis]|uniref:WD_REPEATS_REGION domain-containing protein n=1 Tax=Enterobius vermicularis TaxID=51028 RepID=A0A3P6IJ08_ENTVE|nr:unnamed protein product [Enterobius vermicularis]